MIFANYSHQSCMKMSKSFIFKPENFFFCRNLENGRMPFLCQCNVEKVSHLGFQSLSCSKVAGFEGGFFQKLFKGNIFCFLGHLVGGKIFEEFARETNLKKKRSVRLESKSCKGFFLQINFPPMRALEFIRDQESRSAGFQARAPSSYVHRVTSEVTVSF